MGAASKAIGKIAKRIGGRKLSGAVRRGMRSAEQTVAKGLVNRPTKEALQFWTGLSKQGTTDRNLRVGMKAAGGGQSPAKRMHQRARQQGAAKVGIGTLVGGGVLGATAGTIKAVKKGRKGK